MKHLIIHALQEKIIGVLTFIKSTFKPDLNPESLAPKAQETVNKQPEANLDFNFQIDDYLKCKTNKVPLLPLGQAKEKAPNGP